MAATAVPVTAAHSAGAAVLQGRAPSAGGSGNGGALAPSSPPRTLLFDGRAATLGDAAFDEELHIDGCKCVCCVWGWLAA